MTEYALIGARGNIINVVNTTKPLSEIRRKYVNLLPDVINVVNLDDVPLNTKEKYQYWNERP